MGLVSYKIKPKDFPDDPGAKTPRSQCRCLGLNSWSGSWIPHAAARDPTYFNQDRRYRVCSQIEEKRNGHIYLQKRERERAHRVLLPFLPCGDSASRQQPMDQKAILTWHWICLLDLPTPCQAQGSLTPRHTWMMAWIISSPWFLHRHPNQPVSTVPEN